MSIQTSQTVPEWDLSDRMRKAQREAGISLEQLASDIGYTRQSIGAYLNGRVTPKRSVIMAWAMRCGVSLEWLETGEVPDDGPDSGPDQGFRPPRCKDVYPTQAAVPLALVA